MAGTVNISRDLWDDTAFAADPFSEREAWVWLIAEASWKPRVKRVGDHVVDLARGQLAHSTRFLAETWGWTHSKARRYLDRLEKLKLIERQTDTGVSVITICKYDKYQSPAQAADTGPTQDRHRTGTNEKKGEIREKEGNYSVPNGTGSEAAATVDFTKEVFDMGVAFLGKYGTGDRQARALIGKWRKEAGDTETFNAIRDADVRGVTEPVSWITARLTQPQPQRLYDLTKFRG